GPTLQDAIALVPSVAPFELRPPVADVVRIIEYGGEIRFVRPYHILLHTLRCRNADLDAPRELVMPERILGCRRAIHRRIELCEGHVAQRGVLLVRPLEAH